MISFLHVLLFFILFLFYFILFIYLFIYLFFFLVKTHLLVIFDVIICIQEIQYLHIL